MEILFLKMSRWTILPQETTKDILVNILHLRLYILVSRDRATVPVTLDFYNFTVNDFDQVQPSPHPIQAQNVLIIIINYNY